MTERKAGWYWVNSDATGWVCARYAPERVHDGNNPWFFSGVTFEEGTWLAVGPRIPSPDEPWKCVPIYPDKAMNAAGREYTHAVAHMWDDMLAVAPSPGDNQ